jgi:hypothetical protein
MVSKVKNVQLSPHVVSAQQSASFSIFPFVSFLAPFSFEIAVHLSSQEFFVLFSCSILMMK